MRLLREGITSFAAGVNDSLASDEYRPDQAQVLVNMRPSLIGNALEWLDEGERLSVGWNFQQSTDATCFGAIEYYTSLGVQQIVAFFSDAAYYSTDGGRTFTEIATGLDEAYWSFAIMTEGGNPVLCAANGGTNAYQWDGTTWSTIAGIPSGVTRLAVHGNRLIAAGDSGAQVSASKVGDIDTWASPDGWVVNADDGSDHGDITGLFSVGGVILVFKSGSFGFIEGYGFTTLQVAAGSRGVSRSVGCVAPRSIAPIGTNAVMFLSELGFIYYRLGAEPELVSTMQERFVAKINRQVVRTYPGLPSAIWVPDRQEYWCAVPLGVGLGPNIQATNNTWIYVFRPATAARPPATYFRYPTNLNDGTITVGSDGMLDVVASDLTNSVLFVDERGMLDITKLPDPGLWARITDRGMLEPDGASYIRPAALFTADSAGRSDAPFAGTHESGILEYDRAPNHNVPYVNDGDFAATSEWGTANVTISGGVATFAGSGTMQLFQTVPYKQGRTYRVRYEVSGRTAGSVTPLTGNNSGTAVSANGTYEEDIVAGSEAIGAQSRLMFVGLSSFDGSIDNVSMVDVTGDEKVQVGIVRTRPITYGDEFTRKRGKRLTVISAQKFAHTVTSYLLTDLVYGAAHSLAFTASDAPQERRARVGGARGRVLQAEVHVNADCLIDGIELDAKPLSDQP